MGDVMPQFEPSAEIERFLDRLIYSCSEAAYVSTRQRVLRDFVTRFADAYGWDALRSAALARLSDSDPRSVERGLSCLFVVGTSDDVPAVERLTAHSDVDVQKAARTCLFELRHGKA